MLGMDTFDEFYFVSFALVWISQYVAWKSVAMFLLLVQGPKLSYRFFFGKSLSSAMKCEGWLLYTIVGLV